ncbi:hypothetical protein BJX70DRAFT_401385 [Aspergillus crustosus]
MLSSPYWRRYIQRESEEPFGPRDGVCLEIPISLNPIPFLFLMLIIYGRKGAIFPKRVTLDRLLELAQLVHQFECYEVVRSFTSSWARDLRKKLPENYTHSAQKWLFISWVIQKKDIFEQMDDHGDEREDDLDAKISDPAGYYAINRGRNQAIADVLEELHDLWDDLSTADDECLVDSTGMGILPRQPEAPYDGLSRSELIEQCKVKLHSPGMWNLKHANCGLSARVAEALEMLPKFSPLKLNEPDFDEVRPGRDVYYERLKRRWLEDPLLDCEAE